MAKNKVLIVDDEPGIRFGLRDYLEINGFGVEESSSAREALDKFQSFRPDVVIADYLLEDGNALDLLAKLRAAAPEIPVIILTGHGSIDLAVRAIKEGAEQFLTKPVELPALLIMMQRLIENTRNRHKQMARASVQAREAVDPFRGTSAAIRDLAEQASRVMASDSAVLIQGETGTGKGVLAHWLHNNGPRADEAFVDLNCAGLAPEFLETELFGHEKGAFTSAVSSKQGLLEVAHRGTVFLDEIGDVDLHVQPKLLKVLEEKRFRRLGAVRDLAVDIRLIAATHQHLATLVREKYFRSDLCFWISPIPLMVPSLAQRPEDIPILAEHLLRSLGPDLGRGQIELTLDAVKALQSYGWPGNIRELRNVLERALLLSDQSVLRAADLRFESNGASDIWTESSDMTLLEFEQRLIERVINEEHGRVEQAARRLAIPKSSLYQKIKKYGIVVSRH